MSFIESPVVLLTFLQQNRNPDDLNRHHPHAAFDAERAAGDPRRPGRARRHHGHARDVAADAVAEERAGGDVPADVDADRQPEVPPPLVREREQDAGEEQVGHRDRRDAPVAAVQRGEEARRDRDRAGAAPRPQLLVDVAAEHQLLVQRGGDEDGDELEPWEAAPASVAQRLGGGEEAGGGDGDARRDREAEGPAAALDEGDDDAGRDDDAEELDPFEPRPPDGGGEHLEAKDCGKIDGTQENDRPENPRHMKKWTIDVSAFLLRLPAGVVFFPPGGGEGFGAGGGGPVAAGLIFFPHGWGKVFGAGGAATFAQDMPSYGIPVFFGYVAAYAELVCAVLLIAGLLTRLDALLLAGTMFVAAFIVQLPDALRDPQGGGNKFFAALHGIEL